MRLIIFMMAILSVFEAAGQNKKLKNEFLEPTPREELHHELANECFNSHKYNRLQRLKIYPFNKAKEIKLISFKADDFIPVKNKNIDYSRVNESQLLNPGQTDELTNILHNVGYDPNFKVKYRITNLYKCYEPRNGILFLNSEGKAFEFIEICFECHGTRSSSNKVKEGIFCNQKFSLLKDFFKNTGIKYGLTRDPILSYPEILQLKDTSDLLHQTRIKLENKVINGDDISRLSNTEQKLLFLFNSQIIYRVTGSGLLEFYFNYSGEFYQQTASILAEVGAVETLAALKSSILQWPGENLPKSRAARRKILYRIVNEVAPKWQTIEKGLYLRQIDDSGEVLIQKEDLDGLIFNYLIANKDLLKD